MGSYSFDPAVPFVISPKGEQIVGFSGCELAEEIPAGATACVRAKVHIFCRVNGGGKSDD